jgi:hypothetical protein
MVLSYRLDDQEFKSCQGLGIIFLFITMSRLVLGPTQSTIQWLSGALSLGVKWLGHEADLSPPSNAKIKNAWSCTSTLPIHLHGMVLSQSTGTILPYLYYKLHFPRISFKSYLFPKDQCICCVWLFHYSSC